MLLGAARLCGARLSRRREHVELIRIDAESRPKDTCSVRDENPVALRAASGG